MGLIQVNLPDELERRLRVEIARRGGKKGDLSQAVSDALELWLKAKP
jgi:plasmid stability protein